MTTTENPINSDTKMQKKKKKAKVKVFAKNKKYSESESSFIEKLQKKYEEINVDNVKTFADLPLSPKTLKGLKSAGYTKPTEIQRETIGLALRGKDILGAAQTGSGKTLAFLIPLLEVLYCKQWTKLDGLGALVITPTRELAYQIFETLRKIGINHDFSAGLVIGGKDLKFERKRMDQCNIVIGTPGRLLQHMDENPLFDCVNMQVLVLDEADRCLDMGFQQTMNAIIENLPPQRQTMLFSATQTRSVRDLARLSLKDPSYVSVHENAKHSTPSGLQQNYVICKLEDKVTILWSFIKNHLKQKCIIFFSTCKQVKYYYEAFCRLRPGTSLLALYGTLHQLRRMNIYETFCRKTSAVLFATDIAARGLDFPEVHWVVQADCPEDAATYIHRVGRTARYHRGGESLLLLLPNEVQMLEDLEEKKIPISKIDINPLKLNNPVRKMEAFLARDPALKDTAKRAVTTYAKSVFLMKNKKIFDVHSLNIDAYAASLGLLNPPRLRFLQRRMNAKNSIPTTGQGNKIYFNDEESDNDVSKMENFNDEEHNNDVSKVESYDSDVSNSEQDNDVIHSKKEPTTAFSIPDSNGDDDLFEVKRANHDFDLPSENEMEMNSLVKNRKKKALTKAAVAKKILKMKIVPNKKIVFDDDGQVVNQVSREKQSELAQKYENEGEGGLDIEKAKEILREEDKFDKKVFKERVKAKHKEEKRKLKEKKRKEQEEHDDFGEAPDDEPDLSWLPDPDKIYGKKDTDEEIEEATGTEAELSNNVEDYSQKLPTENKKSKKRKFKAIKPEQEPPKAKKKKKIEDISKSLTVNEAEELAMLLLKSK